MLLVSEKFYAAMDAYILINLFSVIAERFFELEDAKLKPPMQEASMLKTFGDLTLTPK